MAKSYKEAKQHFKDRLTSLTLTGSLPILNGLNGKPLLATLYSVLVVIALLELKDEYNKIGKCKEFQSLSALYNEIVEEIKNNMSKLELNSLGEKYLYLRYLIDNYYLSIHERFAYQDKIKYSGNKLARPLSLNGHNLPSSNALLLEDVLRSSVIATGSVKGKVIKTGVKVVETNNMPGSKVIDSRTISLQDRINMLNQMSSYLTVADNGKGVYFLNPNATEVYTAFDSNLKYLISDKGNVFRISGTDSHYSTIDEELAKATINDLLDYKTKIISKIEEQKPVIDELREEIDGALKDAEDIYKKLTLYA